MVLVRTPITDPAFLLLVKFYFNHHKRTRSLRAKRDAQRPKATASPLDFCLRYPSSSSLPINKETHSHGQIHSLSTPPPSSPLHLFILPSSLITHPPRLPNLPTTPSHRPLATSLQQTSYHLRSTSQVSLTPTRYIVDGAHIHMLLANTCTALFRSIFNMRRALD